MTNNYIDEFSQYHAKEVTVSNPLPTNDGAIHTAYANKLELPISLKLLNTLFDKCLKDGKIFQRLPNKPLPPVSRDVILGFSALDILKPEHLNGWSFSPFPIPEFSAIELIKQLWELRPRFVSGDWVELLELSETKIIKLPKNINIELPHRNYFWLNNLDQLYRFTFSVPLTDRYSILKQWNEFEWYKPSHILYRGISYMDSLLPTESGIRWLKYGKSKEAMLKEFPSDHIFRSL